MIQNDVEFIKLLNFTLNWVDKDNISLDTYNIMYFDNSWFE